MVRITCTERPSLKIFSPRRWSYQESRDTCHPGDGYPVRNRIFLNSFSSPDGTRDWSVTFPLSNQVTSSFLRLILGRYQPPVTKVTIRTSRYCHPYCHFFVTSRAGSLSEDHTVVVRSSGGAYDTRERGNSDVQVGCQLSHQDCDTGPR